MDDGWLAELSELLRIPSVSADPAHAADVQRAGQWVCDFVSSAGGSCELVQRGERPLALGELRASADGDGAPTVLVYGHFDVQPPAPLDEWESDPFEPDVRDGWLYARGVADDKGQLYLLLKAAALLAAEGSLPVNIRVACDGEEEVGGHSIVDFLAEDKAGADVCVIFDGGMLQRDVPAFFVATRGVAAFRVFCQTGTRDLHSGLYGGAAMNATHALVQTLAGVLPREGRLAEPLRQGRVPPSEEELESWRTLRPGAEELEQAGAVPLDPRAAKEFYLRTWAEPSLDVVGILGGKPGVRNTTISARAVADLTIRLAPGQDLETIIRATQDLLREAAPGGARLEFEEQDAAPPGLIPADAPAVQLGLDAFERALGVRPLLVRSGGTLPIVPALAGKGMPTILSGFALPESNIHSPNERMLLDYFPRGIEAAQELYRSFAALR